jgi:hypothetical protein
VVVHALTRRSLQDRRVVTSGQIPRRRILQARLLALGLRLGRLVGKRPAAFGRAALPRVAVQRRHR